jgi:single-stranded-DNA-specific exonuclease
MATADLATRLLLASDEALAAEAQALAQQLDAENTRRREEEHDIVAAARKAVDTDPDIGAHPVLVVAGDGWHRGVIGIVASKLVDAYYRPAIVLSVDQGEAHGSCRSIPGFDVLAALESCAPLLHRFGGHKQAAGLQLAAADIPAFRRAVNAYALDRLGPDDLRPHLHLDGPLAFAAITPAIVEQLAAMAPFGMGNPRPLFSTTPIDVVDGPRRLKDRHLKMSLRQAGRTFRALAWNAVEKEPVLTGAAGALEIAYSLEQNEFNGTTYTELRLSDARRPG